MTGDWKSSEGSDDTDELHIDECLGCCGSGLKLYVCDKCPRGFCKDCLFTAYGDSETFQDLDDENKTWLCLSCKPSCKPPIIDQNDRAENECNSSSLSSDGSWCQQCYRYWSNIYSSFLSFLQATHFSTISFLVFSFI
jgi:hypothetical protein